MLYYQLLSEPPYQYLELASCILNESVELNLLYNRAKFLPSFLHDKNYILSHPVSPGLLTKCEQDTVVQ